MNVDLHQLLIVFAAYVIAAGSPGPSNMRIMGVAMARGRGAALMLASGVVSGSIFWGFMASTGISALLARYAQALLVLQVFGGFTCYSSPSGRDGRRLRRTRSWRCAHRPTKSLFRGVSSIGRAS